MIDVLVGLLLCLMAVQTSQDDGIRNKTNSVVLGPKTFRGSVNKVNHTKLNRIFLHPSLEPHLDVDPEDPVTSYTTGVISIWVIPSLYIVAMLVGIPSNTYILAFLRVRLRAKSLSTLVLYLNLALSDLLLLLCLGLRVHYHFNRNNWVFGEISCRLFTALFYGNVYSSAQTIACISLKRYLAVVRPFLYRRMVKSTLAIWMSLVVWFLFVVAVVPELLVRQSYHLPQLGITTCHDVLPLEEKSHSPLVLFRLLLLLMGFILPFLVCIYTHVAMVYHLGHSASDWRPFIRVSTLVFIIFLVCFLPSGILHTVHYIRLMSSGDDRLYGYYRLAVCLCCFHSCLDPFLCLLISKTAGSELQFISVCGISHKGAVST